VAAQSFSQLQFIPLRHTIPLAPRRRHPNEVKYRSP
jgi:hypothetical protein